jgi:hypothetical protein
VFSAVWTTITPGGAAGKHSARPSRLPGRLNPVTWQKLPPVIAALSGAALRIPARYGVMAAHSAGPCGIRDSRLRGYGPVCAPDVAAAGRWPALADTASVPRRARTGLAALTSAWPASPSSAYPASPGRRAGRAPRGTAPRVMLSCRARKRAAGHVSNCYQPHMIITPAAPRYCFTGMVLYSVWESTGRSSSATTGGLAAVRAFRSQQVSGKEYGLAGGKEPGLDRGSPRPGAAFPRHQPPHAWRFVPGQRPGGMRRRQIPHPGACHNNAALLR